MYKIVIPSYKRPHIFKEKTLKLLQEYNINFSQVYLFLRNDIEKEEYKKICGFPLGMKVIITGNSGTGIMNIRNRIGEYFRQDQELLCIDDDIEEIQQLNNHTKKLEKLPDLKSFITSTFKLMNNEDSRLCGVYPVNNHYFMDDFIDKGLVYIPALFQFTILDKKSEERTYSLIEDFEKTIKYHHKFKTNLRYKYITIKTKYYCKEGGIHEGEKDLGKSRDNKNKNIEIDRMLKEYPQYCKKKDKSYTSDIVLRDEAEGKIDLKKLPIQLYNYIDDAFDSSELFVEKFDILKVNKKKIYKPARYLESNRSWLNLDKEKNYLIYDKKDDELIAIVLRNKIREDYLTEELFDYMNEKLFYELSNNRGDIAGVVQSDKIEDRWLKKMDWKKYKFNKTGSRSKNSNFNFCNNVWCITMGKKKGDTKYKFNKSLSNELLFKKKFKNINELFNQIYKRYYIDILGITDISNDNLYGRFSTLTFNKSLRSAVHKDKNNTNNFCLCCMVDNKIISNKFEGGELLLCDYHINTNLQKDKDIIMFKSKTTAHCNNPISTTSEEYFNSRVSMVYFSR
jgi:hypothetical protein